MATIIQINRIATNRSGAVSDTVTRLQSTTPSDVVNIRAQHLPLAAGQFSIDSGTGLITPTPTTINLSDVQTYATTTARNAATDVTWHVGDVAIVTGPTTTTGAFTDSTYNALAFPSATTVRLSSGSWDTATSTGVGIAVDDVIQFRAAGTGVIAGSTTGPSEFRITNIAQFASDQALITIDHSVFPAGGVQPLPSSGDDVFIQGVGGTVPANTYIYTGTDQTSAAATMDSDWTVLRTPTASETGGLPTTKTAQTGTLDLDPRTSGITVSGNDVAFSNTLFTYSAGATGTVMFPTAASTVFEVYVDGLKISANEISERTATSFTLSNARTALTNTDTFVVEIVWRD